MRKLLIVYYSSYGHIEAMAYAHSRKAVWMKRSALPLVLGV